MPVYNAAKYVRAALDSLIAQDWEDWEAICVDDGSTDESGIILDICSAKDSRIHVVHQTNRGEGAARNTALPLIKGEYFTCLDADDVMLQGALKACAETLASGKYDAICCQPLFMPFKELSEIKRFNNIVPVTKNDVVDRMTLLYGEKGCYGFVSGRVYNTNVFREIKFPVGMKMCADAWHWIDVITFPAKWVTINRPMIGYRQVAGSASNTFDAEFNRCILKAFEHACFMLRKIDKGNNTSVRLFWNKNGPIVLHHLKQMFRDWPTFTRADRCDLAKRAEDIPLQMGWNPFSWHMRLRFKSLKSSASFIVLPIFGFMCDRLWPRIKRLFAR